MHAHTFEIYPAGTWLTSNELGACRVRVPGFFVLLHGGVRVEWGNARKREGAKDTSQPVK